MVMIPSEESSKVNNNCDTVKMKDAYLQKNNSFYLTSQQSPESRETNSNNVKIVKKIYFIVNLKNIKNLSNLIFG